LSDKTHHPVKAAFVVPIDDIDLQWLGTLSVIWSQVEYCVEAAIYSLQGLSFSEGRQQISLPRDLSAKADRLAALAGDHCEDLTERRAFLALCKRIAVVAPLRNLAIHGHWCRLRDHGNAPGAVSWFKVPADEKVHRLLPEDLPHVTIEAGAISRALYELLAARRAFIIIER